MPSRSRTCPKCGGRMVRGFVTDNDSGITKVGDWAEGEPAKGFFGTIKMRGRVRHAIETYRCERCSLLESYAP